MMLKNLKNIQEMLFKVIDCLISDKAIKPDVNKLETTEQAIAKLKKN